MNDTTLLLNNLTSADPVVGSHVAALRTKAVAMKAVVDELATKLDTSGQPIDGPGITAALGLIKVAKTQLTGMATQQRRLVEAAKLRQLRIAACGTVTRRIGSETRVADAAAEPSLAGLDSVRRGQPRLRPALRDAIVTRDLERIWKMLIAEVFTEVDLFDADPEVDRLLAEIWPAFCARHGVEACGDAVQVPVQQGRWLKVKARWLPLLADTFAEIAKEYGDDLLAETALRTKLERLAKEQKLSGGGVVVDEAGRTYSWSPGEFERQALRTSVLARNAAARAVEAASERAVLDSWGLPTAAK